VRTPSPRRLATSIARRLRGGRSADRIRALTGASRDEWREIAAAFPGLPRDPGPAAARARLRLGRRWSRALATGRWRVRVDGAPPEKTPTVYVTAHVGSLQALRYVLRSRGVAAATVHGPFNLDRSRAVRDDRIFDARYGLDYPHALAADRPHRLRTALETGSLILAADLPADPAAIASVLGGRVALDARPLRLARATRVPCRAAFLTLPREDWTLTLSPPLAGAEAAALRDLSRALERVTMRAPLDLDPTVYLALARRGALTSRTY
jgi:hypothetical protein